ncbi:hypothetical protein GQ457_12G000100 [Hibiscus cannabinus]
MSCSIRRFWWSGKGSARGWPLVAWDDICLPKAAGGIGFKDLHLFNIALLGKQIWRLLSAPGSLLYRTLRAKYSLMGTYSALQPLHALLLLGKAFIVQWRRFLSAAVNSWFPGKPVGIMPNFWPICPPGTWIAY